VIAGVLLLGPVAAVRAQPPGGVPVGPAFNPYMNLLRRNNPTYLNYYGLVRPQLEFRQSIQGLRQDLGATQAQTQQLQGEAALPATGHSTSFMNSSRYFMTNAGGGMSRAGGRPGFGARPTPGGGGQVGQVGAASSGGAARTPTRR
jgi:hypothetical protein